MRQKVCINGSGFTRRRTRILLSVNVLDMDLEPEVLWALARRNRDSIRLLFLLLKHAA